MYSELKKKKVLYVNIINEVRYEWRLESGPQDQKYLRKIHIYNEYTTNIF